MNFYYPIILLPAYCNLPEIILLPLTKQLLNVLW